MAAPWLPCSRCRILFQGDHPARLCSRCAGNGDAEDQGRWFYAINRQKVGPVSWQQLKSFAGAGRIGAKDMVLRDGTQQWLAAASIRGLFQTADDPTILSEKPTRPPESRTTPDAAGDTSAPPTVRGYEILGELGRGGMGVVYLARQAGLKRQVALKMILAGAHAGPQQLARFRAEAEAVAKLQHPNIVQVYEVGEQDGQPYFSLELVDGGGLDKKLDRTPLPPKEAAALLETLARAVHTAHLAGIIHRDLKPANVLLTRDGQPKITDFGLAKQLDAAAVQTHTGSIMGTPSYMAPEQATGQGTGIGPATDVYALGAILYEMLTGNPPFRGATSLDTILLVMSSDVVPPTRLQPKLPRDLETICLKCLEKDAARRYTSALDLAEDLRRYQAGEAILARPAGFGEQLWRWCRRYPVAASLFVAVTLGSAFGMAYLSSLSSHLVRSTALESAAQEAAMLDDVNKLYSSRVVERVKPFGVEVTHDYLNKKGAIPLPATLTIDLGREISKSESGMQVRLYSDYPFKSRTDGGARDQFEKDALVALKKDPTKAYYDFEDYGGKPVLRYAAARKMSQTCVDCHNSHPESTKQDWKVGEVRGVLEIIRPLDRDMARTREGLRGTFVLIGVISAALLGVSGLVLVVANRRRGRMQSGPARSGP